MFILIIWMSFCYIEFENLKMFRRKYYIRVLNLRCRIFSKYLLEKFAISKKNANLVNAVRKIAKLAEGSNAESCCVN